MACKLPSANHHASQTTGHGEARRACFLCCLSDACGPASRKSTLTRLKKKCQQARARMGPNQSNLPLPLRVATPAGASARSLQQALLLHDRRLLVRDAPDDDVEDRLGDNVRERVPDLLESRRVPL